MKNIEDLKVGDEVHWSPSRYEIKSGRITHINKEKGWVRVQEPGPAHYLRPGEFHDNPWRSERRDEE